MAVPKEDQREEKDPIEGRPSMKEAFPPDAVARLGVSRMEERLSLAEVVEASLKVEANTSEMSDEAGTEYRKTQACEMPGRRLCCSEEVCRSQPIGTRRNIRNPRTGYR